MVVSKLKFKYFMLETNLKSTRTPLLARIQKGFLSRKYINIEIIVLEVLVENNLHLQNGVFDHKYGTN